MIVHRHKTLCIRYLFSVYTKDNNLFEWLHEGEGEWGVVTALFTTRITFISFTTAYSMLRSLR
jgi:hypothetical protein